MSKTLQAIIIICNLFSDLPLFIISDYRLCNFMTYVVVYNYSLYLFTF